MSLTVEQAERVYNILVEHAGASPDPDERLAFTSLQVVEHVPEYRFIGGLGFGGKFWIDSDRWFVTCYREDETPARLAMIETTNQALADLRSRIRTGADMSTRSGFREPIFDGPIPDQPQSTPEVPRAEERLVVLRMDGAYKAQVVAASAAGDTTEQAASDLRLVAQEAVAHTPLHSWESIVLVRQQEVLAEVYEDPQTPDPVGWDAEAAEASGSREDHGADIPGQNVVVQTDVVPELRRLVNQINRERQEGQGTWVIEDAPIGKSRRPLNEPHRFSEVYIGYRYPGGKGESEQPDRYERGLEMGRIEGVLSQSMSWEGDIFEDNLPELYALVARINDTLEGAYRVDAHEPVDGRVEVGVIHLPTEQAEAETRAWRNSTE